MKILHTADIHLTEEREERWEALRHLVELAGHEDADVLAISGDLFDAEADARTMRNELRGVFSDTAFRTVLIPGNHDAGAFQQGLDFGDRVHTIDDPGSPVDCGEARLWGLPFAASSGEETLKKLRSLAPSMREHEGANILLFHGELLDAFYSGSDYGDEEGRYMPAKLSYFREVPVDYVLAGHFHSSWDQRRLQNEVEGYFVYPGSPVSVTRRETDPRKANLFEVGQPPAERELQTRYYADVDIELDPLDEEADPVERVEQKLDALPDHAAPLLTVRGYVNAEALDSTEREIVEKLREVAADRCVEAHFPLADVSRVVEDELFQRFSEKVSECPDGQQKRMRDLMIRAMTEAGS